MAAAKKTPAKSADLHARAVTMAAEVTKAAADAAQLETELGSALVAGDEAKAVQLQEDLSEATARAQRLAVGVKAFKAATEAAEAAEEVERHAALVRELNAELAAADKDFHTIIAAAAALREPADAAREHLKRAHRLSYQVSPTPAGQADRTPRANWPEGLLRSLIVGSVGQTWGEALGGAKAEEAAAKLVALCPGLMVDEP